MVVDARQRGESPIPVLDIELSHHDIQALNSPDALAAFFARLGYSTNARTTQTPGNLGITADGTVRSIKKIELLADQEGLFQVYLFVLTGVTVANTRALARAFRNRAGNYLLVLTSDYDRLDFVLLEKFLPADKGDGLGVKQVGIRPRVLSVERVKPSRLEIRVLRRLTWTESDPFAQYDKLLSAYALADWSEEYFNNRALFSDYYLKERLREFPAWKEDPKPAYLKLREFYQGASSRFAAKDKAYLRKELLEPVFTVLGFRAESGRGASSRATEPDYRLYRADNGASLLALCLVYPWERSLDGKDDRRDAETRDENPGAVVVSLLEKGEAPWAIVTNGRLWRLYSQRTHSRATNYYEIDLDEAIAQAGPHAPDPAESFRYFWLLFRGESFIPAEVDREGKKVSLSLLDRLFLESEDYAKELGERLKERVFVEVFPHVAEGLIHHIREREGSRTDLSQERLDKIFQGTLTLLYRMLFLLYAEARNLLPVKEVRGYFEASLTKLKSEMAQAAETLKDEAEKKLKRRYREDSYDLYEQLSLLFRIVDKGDPSLNVPVYNGGLFLSDPDKADESAEAEAARFLTDTKVPDRFLARAIDLLARDEDPKRHDLVFIDFKSLGVRHLGSIYEGLLEFKLRIADKKLGIVKEKGREIYTDFSELDERARERAERQERIVRKGHVYLENDKRERKATGSYYTPDHIVKYIVEHAVGPVLQEKFEAMRPKLREAQQKRRAFFDRQEALRKQGLRPEPESKADLIGQDVVDELFNIKVLDPAMGSGHFLVEAVDYITDKALDFLNAFPWNPVVAYLNQMRETILSEMEKQEVVIDGKRLTDVNLLKRHILKRCIYGVDLNPMAVELAKVSLWLDCFTLGAPLSFLDHHLRCGNSLIGVTVDEVNQAIQKGQLSLLSGTRFEGMKQAVAGMIRIGELSDVTAAQVTESRREYLRASEAMKPAKRLLDVYASQWFGNTPRKSGHGKKRVEHNRALEFLRDAASEKWAQTGNTSFLSKEWKEAVTVAHQAFENKRFFHWELEFPEVFYGPRPGTAQAIERLQEGGFDAVIGNPPYIAVDSLNSEERKYFPSRFSFLHRKYDVMTVFLYKVRTHCRPNGLLGMIVPQIWQSGVNYDRLRKELLCIGSRVIRLVNLPFNTFRDAYIDNSVVILERCSEGNGNYEFLYKGYAKHDSADDLMIAQHTTVPVISKYIAAGNPVATGRLSQVTQRLVNDESRYIRLGAIVDCCQGPVESFLSLGSKLNPNENAPQVYAIPEVDRYVCKIASRHRLKGFSEENYRKFYTKPRILARRILSRQDRLLFGAASEPFVCKKDFNPIVPNDSRYPLFFLLAVLNSNLISRLYIASSAISMKDDFRQTTLDELKDLPISRIDAETSMGGTDIKRQLQDMVSLYQHLTKTSTEEKPADTISLSFAPVLKLLDHTAKVGDRLRVFPVMVVNFLADLGAQMVNLNELKEAEVERYLRWLEKELRIETKEEDDAPIETLTGKTVLKEYLGDYQKSEDHASFEALWEVLQRNSSRLGRHLDKGFEEKMRKEYEKSLGVLLPIKQKLTATDWLIDQLVYRLYGLTEEEIVIVEGKQ